jgi:hypothetical protein
MALTLDGTNGVTFNDTSLQGAAASPYVLKNRIINGAMQIWQRGTSFTSTTGYTADRWSAAGFPGVNASQSTSVPTITTGNAFQYSLKIGRPVSSTATSVQLISQCIESNNCYDLSGQTVTFSFWAKAGANYSSASNALSLSIYTGTVADQGLSYPYYSWTGAAIPLATAITISTTWTKYSYTVTFGANVLESALFFFYTPSGTAGADDNFYITGVQLEIGSTATPFERRLYDKELISCQRYYQQYNSFTAYFTYAQGNTPTTTSCSFIQPLQVYMRTTPSLVTSAAATFQILQFSSTATVSVVALSTGTPFGLTYTTTNSALTVNTLATIRDAGSNNSYIAANAEL